MTVRRRLQVGAVVIGTIAAACAGPVDAQFKRMMPRPGAGAAGPGVVQLPYNVADGTGNTWMIYNGGMFQQQGNQPIYSQGAMLQVNGNQPQARTNQGKLEEKTGELVLDGMQCGAFTVTRRVLVNKEEGWVRYVDVLKNTTNQEQAANLIYTTNTNYGVQSATTVADPKRKDNQIAWVAATHANGRTVVEMFGGKGAKSVPVIQYQQGNNSVQMSYTAQIGAGKEVALMHFHVTTASADAGQKWVANLKESKMMATLPAAIRRLVVNFRGGENFVGDFEILRGDILDVVELKSGDQLKGTLKEKSFKLQAFYGAVELPVDKVIGLINAGEFRPRQLVVTKDGEIFGGKLDRDKLSLEMSSGQVTEIPITQISRVGYRKRAGEPEEWLFDKPTVLMRSGDRIGVKAPTGDFEVATRYGPLKLKPDAVSSIAFQSEEHGVHEIRLTDGSKFAGLVGAESFEMKLGGDGPEQAVKFPASSIRRLQISPSEEPDGSEAQLNLANEDVLVGVLTGTLKLDTAFSTITLNAAEIKRLAHAASSPADVTVTLWDETTVSGQLQDQELACKLKCGVEMKVPVALLEEYSQPRPQPSAQAVEAIKALAGDLAGDDAKARDAAQEKLTAMGTAVTATLKELRAKASPEAQQRIDAVLKAVENAASKDGKKAGPDGGNVQPPVPMPMPEG